MKIWTDQTNPFLFILIHSRLLGGTICINMID